MDIPPGIVTVLMYVFTGGLAVEVVRRGAPILASWLRRRGPIERMLDQLQEENRALWEENRALRDELRKERGRMDNDD